MENTSKALLIAGGVLIALLVLSLLVLGYNSLTGYMSSDTESKKVEQLAKFNASYEAYARSGVRGNELLTLMNKIIDYNARESDNTDINYQRMTIIINIGAANIANFKYENASSYDAVVYQKYDNTSNNDNDLLTTSNTLKNLTTTYGFSEAQLQKLSNNIANIFVEEENYPTGYVDQYIKSRESLLKTILGKKITDSSNPSINDLKSASSQYYQFTKFKQAYFDCDTNQTDYNKNTGRITKLVFNFKGFYDS